MRTIESGSQFLFAYFHIVLPYIINCGCCLLQNMSWLSNLIIFELIRTWSDIWFGCDYSRRPASRVIDYSDTTLKDRVGCLLLHPHKSICETWSLQCWNCSASRAKLAYDDISYQQSISLYLSYKSIVNFTSCWNVFCNCSRKDSSLTKDSWYLEINTRSLNLLHFIDLRYISSWKAADPRKSLFQFFLLTITVMHLKVFESTISS